MERQTLERYRKRLKDGTLLTRDEQFTLVQNALEALDNTDGGKPIAELRQALSERENAVKDALLDLQDTLRDRAFDQTWANKARFIVNLILKMLRTGKTKDFKSWKDWRVVIDEEFGTVA